MIQSDHLTRRRLIDPPFLLSPTLRGVAAPRRTRRGRPASSQQRDPGEHKEYEDTGRDQNERASEIGRVEAAHAAHPSKKYTATKVASRKNSPSTISAFTTAPHRE